MSHTRLDCPADLAVWLTSNPVCSAWGLLHSLKIVSTEMGVFVANWPLVATHAPTMETGHLRVKKGRARCAHKIKLRMLVQSLCWLT